MVPLVRAWMVSYWQLGCHCRTDFGSPIDSGTKIYSDHVSYFTYLVSFYVAVWRQNVAATTLF